MIIPACLTWVFNSDQLYKSKHHLKSKLYGGLSFPDFFGNRLFNTLGNITDDGRVGIAFPDFETGDLLLVSGRAEIVWDGRRLERFEGAQRLVDVQVEEVDHARWVLPLPGSPIAPSPKLAGTGNWQ